MKKTRNMSAEELADIITNKLSVHLKSVELLSKDDSDGYPLKLLNYLSNGFDDLGEKEIENICELFYHKLRNSIVLEEYASLKQSETQSEWISVEDELLIDFLQEYQKSCKIMHVSKIDAKNFVEHYRINQPPNNKQG